MKRVAYWTLEGVAGQWATQARAERAARAAQALYGRKPKVVPVYEGASGGLTAPGGDKAV